MLRHIFSFVSPLLLMLCVTTVVLWVRSYWVADVLDIGVITCRGDLIWVNTDTSSPRPVGLPHHAEARIDEVIQYLTVVQSSSVWSTDRHWLGLRIQKGDTATSFVSRGRLFGTSPSRVISVPLWMWALLFAATTLAMRFASRLQRRAWANRHTTCPDCSYSLTGSTSGTCPECGMPVPSSAATLETKSSRPA
jgi:hypothetical protein